MCPRHSNICGEQNQPRNRNPLMQCCLQIEANHPWHPGPGQARQYLDNARYAQMMRKNIKIPSNYYISTDPRTLPAEVIKSYASTRRPVTRSSSSVTVRRAQCVKLRTNRVKRAISFSENILAEYRQYSVATNNNLIKNLPWDYRKAGIGVCLKGKSVATVWENKFDLLPLPQFMTK